MEAIQAKLELVKGEKYATIIEDNQTAPEKLISEARTLSFCLNKSLQQGYTENFKATSLGIKSMESGKYYPSGKTKIVNFYHFEGSTDAMDMAVLYLLEMEDGAKGTLINMYGSYSDVLVAKWLGEILTTEKK